MPDPVVLPPPDSTPLNETARAYLAIAVVIQFTLIVGYILYLSTTGKLTGPELIAGAVLGSENTFVTIVLTYYYGSSSGSTAKSAILAAEKK